MDRKRDWLQDSYHCSQLIAEGFERNEIRDIDHGLSRAYDLFVDYVLEDRHDDLLVLGRDLNAVYVLYRPKVTELFVSTSSYLGQLRALINLCDYVTERLVPERLWHVVSRSKYAKPILQTLLENGATLAKDLSSSAGVRHESQLSRTVQPLVDEGLIRREKFGKNIWYSLTSIGRRMASKHLGAEGIDALEAIMPAVVAKLATGWQKLSDLVEGIRVNIPMSTLRPLIDLVLSTLHAAGIAEEQAGNWRIPPSVPAESLGLEDVAAYPELIKVVTIIENEYEQLRGGKVADKGRINEARNILQSLETKVAGDKTKQHTFQARIALDRAKCSALEGDWEAALDLADKAITVAQVQSIDTERLEREVMRVLSYVQTTCVGPQIELAKDLIAKKDYCNARNILLTIYSIYQHVERSNMRSTAIPCDVLELAIGMATAAVEFEEEFERRLDEAVVRATAAYGGGRRLADIERWKPVREAELGYLGTSSILDY